MISSKDTRLYIKLYLKIYFNIRKENQKKVHEEQIEKENNSVKKIIQAPSHLFFKFNTALGPPYHIILDTNFINFSISNKLDIMQSMMDCLLAKCHVYITDCVLGELEKLGQKYRVALRYIIEIMYLI